MQIFCDTELALSNFGLSTCRAINLAPAQPAPDEDGMKLYLQ